MTVSSRSGMVVVSPTYRPDLELFTDLHESFLRCFPGDVEHIVVTPERDLGTFRRFEGPRCRVLSVREALPQRLWAVPGANMWLNPRRPVPPLRGWIVQQLVKLAVAAQTNDRVVVLADADVAFVRPVTVSTFAPQGRARLYRRDRYVDNTLPRHMQWHAVAHRLLGLAAPASPPLPDYISALNVWDPKVVQAMLGRVEEVSGRSWVDTIGRQLHFSEFTLYGVHVDYDSVGTTDGPTDDTVTDDNLCASYWDTTPLTADAAAELASSIAPTDVAVMISAKSSTPLDVRRSALAGLRS